jgi:hypothetical protein
MTDGIVDMVFQYDCQSKTQTYALPPWRQDLTISCLVTPTNSKSSGARIRDLVLVDAVASQSIQWSYIVLLLQT